MQSALHANVDPTRTYGEYSMWWLSWYLGPVAVLAGIGGLATLVWRVVRLRSAAATVLLLLAGITSLLYIWSPSIIPDQVWASRRFVPVTYPLMAIAAALGLELVAALVPARSALRAARTSAVALGCVLVVAWPLVVTGRVWSFQPDRNYRIMFDQTCAALGPNAAVAFIDGEALDLIAPQTIRAWCGLPTVSLAGPVSASELRALATLWQGRGRQLWLLAGTPEAIAPALPAARPTQIGFSDNRRELEARLDGPPAFYRRVIQSVWATPVR